MLSLVMVHASKGASQYLFRSRALDKARRQAVKVVSLNLMALCDVLFNLKYTTCVYKVTVAVHSFGNSVWICPSSPGTRRMFSFGIVKGLKDPRGMIWITRWAPTVMMRVL